MGVVSTLLRTVTTTSAGLEGSPLPSMAYTITTYVLSSSKFSTAVVVRVPLVASISKGTSAVKTLYSTLAFTPKSLSLAKILRVSLVPSARTSVPTGSFSNT